MGFIFKPFTLLILALALSSCGVQIRSLNPARAVNQSLLLEITPQTLLVRGGDALTIDYSIPSSSSPVVAVALQKSLDGGATYTTISHLDPSASQTSWQSPLSDIPDVRFRLFVTTADGRTYTASTSQVEVDATPPAVPAIALGTSAMTNNSVARVTVSSCADRAKIMITQTPGAPSYGAVGWTTCTTTASAFPSNLLADGDTTLYVWAQDLAGNISTTSASTTVTLDATLPIVSLLNLTGGQTVPASVPLSILWSATDAHLGATPISLEVSSDSGANWTTLSTSEANDGTYTWTPPNVSSSTYRVRVSATDTFGNIKSAISVSDFTITNTAPALSFVSSTPTSPSNTSTTPTITGATGASTTSVSLYSDSGCSVSLAAGTRATFVGAGLSITVLSNASTTIYGTATDGALTSGCTYLTTYVHDVVAPAGLTYLSLSPASPSSSLNPKIFGLAASDVSTAKFYSDVGCTAQIGSGAKSDFVSPGPGILLTVGANTTTSIYGKAFDAAGNASACALLTTDIHDNINPDPATALSHAPTFASLVSSPAISWTLAADNVGGSGVGRYEISVGISAGDTRILAWSTVSGGAAPSLPLSLAGLTLTDATTYYVNLRTVDLAGNVSSVVSSTGWLSQNSATPQIAPGTLTLEINTPYTFTTSGGTLPYTYSIVSGLGTINANTGVYTAPATPGGPYTIRVTDGGGLTSDSTVTIVPDQTLPVISSFTLNGGATNASGTTLSVAITATDPGASSTGIADYRFSLTSDFSGAAWVTTPPTFYNFPYESGNKTLYAQVRDGAGNLSAVSSATVTVFVGTPPIITLLKPDGAVLYTSGGQSVHIAWNIVYTYPLDPAGISVAYTTDNGVTYTAWPSATGLSPDSNSGCTIDAGATGCVNLSLPVGLASTPFRIRVKIVDTTANSAYILSPSLNVTGLTLFAGANSTALGAAAKATQLENATSFARDPVTGDYFIYANNSILRLSSATNTISRFAGDPLNWTLAGDGGPVANTRFATGGPYWGGNFVYTDAAGNVYWRSNSGVWKYDAGTGNASIIVGPRGLVGDRSKADGTNGRDFDSGPENLSVTPNGTVYFGLWWQQSPSLIRYWSVYRLESNNTVTRLVGCISGDCPNATDGATAITVGVTGWQVRPGATPAQDEVYFSSNFGSGTEGLYIVNGDGTVTLKRAETSTKFFGSYMPLQGKFILWNRQVNSTGKSSGRLWDPDNPGAAYTTVLSTSQFDSPLITAIEDPAGNILYSTYNGHVIKIRNPSNVHSIFAGVLPDDGDGGPATLAQIREPTQVSFDSSGTAYINEIGNTIIRSVTSSGITSRSTYFKSNLSAHPSFNLSTGIGPAILNQDSISMASNTYGGGTSSTGIAALDFSGACMWFCGPNTNPAVITTSTSANSTLLYRSSPEWWNWVKYAYDGTDLYAYVAADSVDGAGGQHSTIKKIDSGGNLTTVAGNPAIDDTSTINTATPLLGNIIGGEYGFDNFRAANGTLFFSAATTGGWRNMRIYSGENGGSWVKQSNSEVYDYAVSRTDRSMYFIVGTQLFRKDFVANGSGAETLITDFSGSLTSPKVVSMDANNSNTLIIIDQNSIYRYRNAAQIH
jgi:hypothetical protein